MIRTLAESHVYGFEGTGAELVFIVGFAGLAILAFLTIRIRMRLWIMAGMLFATALTAPVDYTNFSFYGTWLLPLQTRRAELALTFGVVLSLLAFFGGRVALHHASFQSIILLIMGVVMAVLQFIHETPAEATKSLGFALATIPCMVVAVPLVTRGYDQCLAVLKAMMMVSVVWTFCCSVQFVINPQLLVNSSGRFWGLLANAQQAAIFCAPLAIIALWLTLNDPQRRNKPLWIALLAINLLFLMWTGSRTGVLMCGVGALAVLSTRLDRALLFVPVAAVMFFALSYLADLLQIGSSVERLVSSENTREGLLIRHLSAAMESPLIGVGWNEKAGGSESSYTGALAAYGIGFGLIVLALLLGSVVMCVNLLLSRRWLPEQQRPLVNMFVSFNAMYFADAAFEGFMMARSSTTLTMMLMFSGIGVWLKEQIAAHKREASHGINPELALYGAIEYGYDDPDRGQVAHS